MPIPSPKDIQIPLLHLIHDLGGEVEPSDVYDRLADYFGLNEKERQVMQPSGVSRKFDNRVAWVRNYLCDQGFLDRSIRGIWKITVKGRRQLIRLGLLDKPFPIAASVKKTKSKDEEILKLVLEKIAHDGSKQFPDDFLTNKDCTNFYEVILPGTQLLLANLSQTVIMNDIAFISLVPCQHSLTRLS